MGGECSLYKSSVCIYVCKQNVADLIALLEVTKKPPVRSMEFNVMVPIVSRIQKYERYDKQSRGDLADVGTPEDRSREQL